MSARGLSTGIAGAVTLIAIGAAVLSGSNAVWGLNCLKYAGVYADYIFSVLIALMLYLTFGPLPLTSIERGLDRVAASIWGRSLVPRLLVSCGLTALFFFCRVGTAFLGDGYFLLNIFGRNEVYSGGWIEWLSYRIIKLVQSAYGGYTYWSALYAFQTVSVVAGFFVVYNFIRIAGMLAESTLGRLISLIVLIFSGWMLLFFGYVEYYPLLWLVASFFLVSALRCVTGRGSLWTPLAWFLLAAAIHLQALVFLPGLLYLTAYKIAPRFAKRLSNRAFSVILLALVALVPVAVTTAGRLLEPQGNPFLSLVSVSGGSGSYAALSVSSLVEISNLAFLCIPTILVLVSLALARGRSQVDHVHRLLVLFTFGSLAFLVVINPKLGLGRDWDLMSLTLLAPALLLLYRASRGAQLSVRGLLAVALLSLAMTVPFLVVDCSTQASTERMHDLLRYYGPKEKGGWVSFAKYLYNDGDMVRYNEVMAELDVVFPDQQDFEKVKNLIAKGKLDEAEALVQRLLVDQPDNGEFLAALGLIRLTQKRFGEARQLYTRALRTHPNHYVYYSLGKACAMDGDYAAAVEALEQARRLSPGSEPVLTELGKVYANLGQAEQAKKVADELLGVNPNSPDGHILNIMYLVKAKRNAEAGEHYRAFLKCGIGHPEYETIKSRYAWLLDGARQP